MRPVYKAKLSTGRCTRRRRRRRCRQPTAAQSANKQSKRRAQLPFGHIKRNKKNRKGRKICEKKLISKIKFTSKATTTTTNKRTRSQRSQHQRRRRRCPAALTGAAATDSAGNAVSMTKGLSHITTFFVANQATQPTHKAVKQPNSHPVSNNNSDSNERQHERQKLKATNEIIRELK